jgi:hypothetical protein
MPKKVLNVVLPAGSPADEIDGPEERMAVPSH